MGDEMDRPMVLIYINFVLGVSTFFIFQYFGILPALLFLVLAFIFLWQLKERSFTFVLAAFLLLGIFSCTLFYNTFNEGNIFRIVSEEKGFYLGSSSFKNYSIYSKTPLIEGERYHIEGEFEKEPEFNKGVVGRITTEKTNKLKSDLISSFQHIKNYYYDKLIEAGLSEKEAAVLLALSVGDSSHISYENRMSLNLLGIAHVISVSGLHLSLIYGVLKKLTGYKLALLLSALFVVFTGMQAATWRAFIMIFLLVMSTKVKRKYDCASAIAVSAFILLLFQPYYIMNMGYVLTFAAVAGILVFNEFFQRRLYRLPLFISNSLSLSISSMVFTTPYLIFTYKKISIGGIISNLILIPFYTIEMFLGIGGIFLLKLPGAFKITTKIAAFVFGIIETLEEILLKFLPSLLKFTYFQGFLILLLYLAFTLVKRGKKELLLFPIVAFILIVLEAYVIFPEINYIAGKNNTIVQVTYKGRNILISGNKVKLKYVYEDIGEIDRIYDEFERDILITLDSSYRIYVVKEGKGIVAALIYKGDRGKILLMEDNNLQGKELQCFNKNLKPSNKEKYDIMVFENDKSKYSLGHYFCKLTMIGPWILKKYIY